MEVAIQITTETGKASARQADDITSRYFHGLLQFADMGTTPYGHPCAPRGCAHNAPIMLAAQCHAKRALVVKFSALLMLMAQLLSQGLLDAGEAQSTHDVPPINPRNIALTVRFLKCSV